MIQELGGDVLAYRVEPADAARGRMIKALGLPRESLVNLIVRDGEAMLPRGSTVVEPATSSICSSAARAAATSPR